MKLIAATGNAGKLEEIRLVLTAHEIVGRPPMDDPVEDGETLLDNARIKARAIVAATGEAALADDTGLFVDALGGAPGVQTAYYKDGTAFAHGYERVLHELADRDDRGATWRTIALVLFPDGSEVWAEGTCTGVIAPEARGVEGFGYDPAFIPDGSTLTFAQMTRAAKTAVSHRGAAFRALADKLSRHL